MPETTHQRDPDTGHMRQIVSPERLREILDADGEDYSPPSGFGPGDEWDVGDTEWPDSAGPCDRCGERPGVILRSPSDSGHPEDFHADSCCTLCDECVAEVTTFKRHRELGE